jgi:hypothetical protein
MSRLDFFISRLVAQRECLNEATRLIGDITGPVLEIGLGSGRTYDHLRSLMPDRDIWVFDRHVECHPTCIPPAERLLLGEVKEKLTLATEVIGAPIALAHVDLGTADGLTDRGLFTAIGPLLATLMAQHGIVVSDRPFSVLGWRALPLPADIKATRYEMYRVERPNRTDSTYR